MNVILFDAGEREEGEAEVRRKWEGIAMEARRLKIDCKT
jgi:hypothetical protein